MNISAALSLTESEVLLRDAQHLIIELKRKTLQPLMDFYGCNKLITAIASALILPAPSPAPAPAPKGKGGGIRKAIDGFFREVAELTRPRFIMVGDRLVQCMGGLVDEKKYDDLAYG